MSHNTNLAWVSYILVRCQAIRGCKPLRMEYTCMEQTSVILLLVSFITLISSTCWRKMPLAEFLIHVGGRWYWLNSLFCPLLSSVASFRCFKRGYKFLFIFFCCSMLIENVFRGGAMRRVTLSVRSAIRCTIILFSWPLHFMLCSNNFEGEKHKLSNNVFQYLQNCSNLSLVILHHPLCFVMVLFQWTSGIFVICYMCSPILVSSFLIGALVPFL